MSDIHSTALKHQGLAIVGMGISLASYRDIDTFERSIYEGQQLCVDAEHPSTALWPERLRSTVNEALTDASIAPSEKVAVITLSNDSEQSHPPMAQWIGDQWPFSKPILTLAADQANVWTALVQAQMLLTDQDFNAVIVLEWRSGFANHPLPYAGGSAIVLKLGMDKSDRIYALIHPTCDAADPEPNIHYLEVCDTDLETLETIGGLLKTVQGSGTERSCALGSNSATLADSALAASGMISLIKTALCLYHRYIPAVPRWSGPQRVEPWQGSPFYVPTESCPWLLEDSTAPRKAVILWVETGLVLRVSEAPAGRSRGNRYLAQMPLCLFAIAAFDPSMLRQNVQALMNQLAQCDSLAALAHQTFQAFQQQSSAPYAIVLLGKNRTELEREIQRALDGIERAIATGEEWQTPAGSYFTPQPLHEQGHIAFIYPGAFGAYLGLARTLFRLFPRLYDDPLLQSVSSRAFKVTQILYPRSWKPFSSREREALEKRLMADPLALLETELAYASFATVILRDYFKIRPHCAFGYSLGETSMMFAQGVWNSFNEGSAAFNASPLFADRLSGPKNAVREYWNLPKPKGEDFWSTYVLMAAAPEVYQCLTAETRVYLTQINTPQEVVIAGETAACQRVIKALGCGAFKAPFNHAIHCEPMRSEYPELARLNTFPIDHVPDLTLYSAAEYQPVSLHSETIGQSIAQNLCQPLDFPRLVNRVYQDGARIFIETGAGSTASRWISQILDQQAHTTVSFNRRGLDEHTVIVRALAKLISHRVPLDLSALFDSPQPAIQSDVADRLTIPIEPAHDRKHPFGQSYTVMHQNNLQMAQVHLNFLQARQDSLEQLQDILQLQLDYAQTVLMRSPSLKD